MPFEVKHVVELPTDTILRAKLKDLQVVERNGRDGTFTKLAWTFEITEQGDYWGMTVRQETKPDFTDEAGNQPREWSEALLGRQLGKGVLVSEGDLIGLPALITISYEDDRKDPNKKWRRVDQVMSVQDDTFQQPPF